MALHAAMEGVGVAIGIDALIEEDVTKGRLVRLFDHARLSRLPFQIVTPIARLSRSRLVEMRNWLLKEGQKSAAARR